MEENKKGRLLYFGLRNGQTVVALTYLPVNFDNGFHIITTTEGETVTVRADEVVYTRSRETDIPTEDEVAEYFQKLLGAMPKDAVREAIGSNDGLYL
ncbi:hypothetical protein [Mycobacterium tuberculosis]|uniref:Uncharacterized protein n=3 Tax=Veracruzvirus heldan TaxID=1032892 RepID=A0A8F3E250_9CAUD|nr:hypothetical protein [Mycobacterium tuberculosis]YP_009637673.1 hypothetical protein FGG19_gp49 [Mycobacterium phage HelDan]ASW31306.1 hypothetical protein SEA_FRED313_48 [Mycobacterium phage Fred313]QWY79589.1 hypothetical protein SEA_SCOUT_48 [Mycobacterium phage Scout]AEJ92067.1 hypothetical protein HELDAN_48 [Mycobacterium phage HelDan]MBP2972711.1 hypothetical protein [Mycobacterium tuberculosis]QTR25195.1 hypothetical protein J8672_12990 [Mycobacterium tuberculosis]